MMMTRGNQKQISTNLPWKVRPEKPVVLCTSKCIFLISCSFQEAEQVKKRYLQGKKPAEAAATAPTSEAAAGDDGKKKETAVSGGEGGKAKPTDKEEETVQAEEDDTKKASHARKSAGGEVPSPQRSTEVVDDKGKEGSG